MKSINIACYNVFPLFESKVAWGIGGMETRAALLARGLACLGQWRVRVVVGNFDQPERLQVDAVEIHMYQPLHRKADDNAKRYISTHKRPLRLSLDRRVIALLWQIPYLFFFRVAPGWLAPVFWRLRKASLTCCFGNNPISAEIISDCTRIGLRTALCLASDDDLDASYQPGDTTLNDYGTPRWMAHYAIENADHVFVQTERQQQLLLERFGRHGEIIRNPVDVSPSDPESWPDRRTRITILWIGRSDTFHKRPLLFLELARRCPELPFVMIANKTDADVFNTLLRERPDNLTIIEQVPHSEIWDYYRRARVFVSTSVYEGFPNTFLQCAVAGVPIASLQVDPEGILAGKGCGLLAYGSMDRLADNVRSLWTDHDLAESYARTSHRYALHNHSLDSQVARFDTLLRKAIGSPLRHPRIPWWKEPFQRFATGLNKKN